MVIVKSDIDNPSLHKLEEILNQYYVIEEMLKTRDMMMQYKCNFYFLQEKYH
jgi:hypothetical protein